MNSSPRYAYVTILSDEYLKGALALNQSIKDRCQYPLLVLCYDVSKETQEILRQNEIEFRMVPMITSPFESAKYRGVYTKLHIFNLTEFDKIIFLDSDTIVVRNIDRLFELDSEFAATALKGVALITTQFSPGLMLVKPDAEKFNELMALRLTTPTYDGGDQGFLNVVFANKWYRIPDEYHVTKRIFMYHKNMWNELRSSMCVIHYPSAKPWHTARNSFDEGYEEVEAVWHSIYERVQHKPTN